MRNLKECIWKIYYSLQHIVLSFLKIEKCVHTVPLLEADVAQPVYSQGYELEDWDSISGRRWDFFCPCYRVQTGSEAHSASYAMGTFTLPL